jgi:hypothetical protein
MADECPFVQLIPARGSLWSTQVTRQGAEVLQAALPECDVGTAML